MSNQALFATKFSQKGAIVGVTGIFLGLLTAFGGVDLPALLIFAFWAIIVVAKNNAWGEILSGIKRGIIPIVLAIFCAGYFIYTRISIGLSFNETSKSFVAALVLLPFLAWAFTGKNYDKTIIRRAFVAGFTLALVFLCFEAINGYAMYRLANPNIDPKELERNLGRGAFILVALLWPLIQTINSLHLDRRFKIALIIGTVFVSTRFNIDLNFVIIIICSIAAGLAYFAPRLVLGAIISGASIILGLAPLFYGYIANYAKAVWPKPMPLSYERRANMWLYTIEKIKEKPIWGWGLDSAKNFQDIVELGGYKWAAIQTHPHSAPLNIWLEGGVIGVLLFASAIVFAGIGMVFYASRNRNMAQAMAGGIVAVTFAWDFSYGIWQQWLWILLFFVCIYSFYGVQKESKTKNYDDFEFIELN